MPDPRQSRLDEIEAQIAREEAEDALLPDDAERPEIATYEGFASVALSGAGFRAPCSRQQPDVPTHPSRPV